MPIEPLTTSPTAKERGLLGKEKEICLLILLRAGIKYKFEQGRRQKTCMQSRAHRPTSYIHSWENSRRLG